MSEILYQKEFSIRLRDTDAAGVIYFARLLQHAHDAYEAFMDQAGLPLSASLTQGPLLPLVHAEVDFMLPLRLGDRVRVAVTAVRVGRSSFTLEYGFNNPAGVLLARARTVHVAIANGKSVALPGVLRQTLKGQTKVS